MRRGFHNVYQFYKRLRAKIPRILAFTMCSAKKNSRTDPVPAYERYKPSPLFCSFWSHVHDLPIDIGILSAKYGLVYWYEYIPSYDHKMTEADVHRICEDLKKKLRSYDKIFFIGLGLYRRVVEIVKQETDLDIEIFPKEELCLRRRLDIIEYFRQMTMLREAIKKALAYPRETTNNDERGSLSAFIE